MLFYAQTDGSESLAVRHKLSGSVWNAIERAIRKKHKDTFPNSSAVRLNLFKQLLVGFKSHRYAPDLGELRNHALCI